MTQKPTFTLTITNGNQGRIAATNAPQPKADNVNRLEDRLMARAQLAATYAGLASIMVVLVFLYMVGAIFIIGAEFNAALLKFEVFGQKVRAVDVPRSKPDQPADVG